MEHTLVYLVFKIMKMNTEHEQVSRKYAITFHIFLFIFIGNDTVVWLCGQRAFNV